MKIKRLRKNHKKEIIVGGLILVSIVSTITFVTTRAKYKVTQDIKIASGTVNYKPYDFKIMAMYQSDDGNDYTEINEMPTSGYVVNEEKSYCTIDNKTQVKGKIKTVKGIHGLYNITKSDKCYIWFDKRELSKETLEKLNITSKDITPDFSQVATTDEGVYSASDGMYGGTSYYWRGAVTNNYVMFANKCWRIIRINGDGSIRLIYDGTTCHANGESTTDSIAVANQAYNISKDNSSYVGWTYTVGSQRPINNIAATESNAKTQLETWYNMEVSEYNLDNFESGKESVYNKYLVTGKFCNDRNIASEYIWSESGTSFSYSYNNRIMIKIPTLNCHIEDIYELKVGIITADEVMYAGGVQDIKNNLFYLYNGQNLWTMTPVYWNSSEKGDYAGMVIMYGTGFLNSGNVSDASASLRPVINLSYDITFSSGNGTQSNPYVVS